MANNFKECRQVALQYRRGIRNLESAVFALWDITGIPADGSVVRNVATVDEVAARQYYQMWIERGVVVC